MIFGNVAFLILFPLLVALSLYFVLGDDSRKMIVRFSALIIALGSVLLLALNGSRTTFLGFDSELLPKLLFAIEIFMTAYICYAGAKHKRYLIPTLAILQFALISYLEFKHHGETTLGHAFYADAFSVIMALIIGIIGTLICVYALGYMKGYHHHHPEVKDRRSFFFFTLFVFLSAMFGIVFSNNLMYLFFFWEVTTLCSFLLIGYAGNKESINNSFRALVMNLTGGLGFAIALVYLQEQYQITELSRLIEAKDIALLPLALLALAGITKSAQMPFSSWLLGAMVAPTPTSALLHSSTMVKAGVFLILKLSPVIQNTVAGMAVALIGGVTFLVASLICISERNAKKVLAYSTIANLGLIVACGGVGSHETVWVGIFLIIFHAVAKSLLFLLVGTVENRLYSKDIENMDNLIVKMPRVALLMSIGITAMFIAPFGMVISKWAAIEAFLNTQSLLGPLLIILIAYGSAATIFYWGKLFGKLLSVNPGLVGAAKLEQGVTGDEWVAEWTHAILSIAVCLLFPLISILLVEPYVSGIYGQTFGISRSNFIIMVIMIGMITVIPASLLFLRRHLQGNYAMTYMSGRTVGPDLQFETALATKAEPAMKNYYLEQYFGENYLTRVGVVVCTIALVLMIGTGIVWRI